ncbi:MAG: DUF4252 domain-containing protein [Terriglobales bacterium]
MRKLLWCFLIPVFILPLAAQQPRLDMHLPALATRANQVSEVTLDGTVLRLGMAFLNDDSGLTSQDRDMLSKLKGIYVKSFEFDHAPRLTDPALAALRRQLRGAGWSRIVRVHTSGHDSDHDNAAIYVCTAQNGSILGMAILDREPDEVNVVNIIGSITPAEVSKLGGNLGIPKLQVGKGGGL